MRSKTRLAILSSLFLAIALPASERDSRAANATQTPPSSWSELNASMMAMHSAMMAVKASGNDDVDFVRLMIPHHQAAIDMAKTQLLFGQDPQMRRLAQEIITDQQSEIDLMRLWLKEHEPASRCASQTHPDTRRGAH